MFDKKILTIIMCCTALIFASCGTTVENNKQDNSSSRYIHTTKTQKITTTKTTTTKKKSTTTTTKAKPKSQATTAMAVIEMPDTTTQTTAYTTPTTTYTQPETTYQEELINYGASFEGTWYEGGYGTYGYSGRTLVSGYSVASNYFPQGTIIHVSGSGLDGTYRVDDKGGMSNNVIDFFYHYGEVPSEFRKLGRVNIQVCEVK